MDLTCSKLGIRCMCDTPLGPVQGDSCSSCHHFAAFGECWWATAGAAPAVCSYLQELGPGCMKHKLLLPAGANTFGFGASVGAAEGREWLSLDGDEVALAGAEQEAHEQSLLPSVLRPAWAGGRVTQCPMTGVTGRSGFTPAEPVAVGRNGCCPSAPGTSCAAATSVLSLGTRLLPAGLSSHPPQLPVAAAPEVALMKSQHPQHHQQLPACAASYAETLPSHSCHSDGAARREQQLLMLFL